MEQPKERYCVIVWELRYGLVFHDAPYREDIVPVISYQLTTCDDYIPIVVSAVRKVDGMYNRYKEDIIRGVMGVMENSYDMFSFRVCIGGCHRKWSSADRGRPLPILKSRYPTGRYVSIYDCKDSAVGHKLLSRSRDFLMRLAEMHSARIDAKNTTLDEVILRMFGEMVSDADIVSF